jgi:peroxiredoxin
MAAMPPRAHDNAEQEYSIKARERELFVEASGAAAARSSNVKPFQTYLRKTPASPLSPLTMTMFWILAIVVGMLFIAALWRLTHRDRARRRPIPQRAYQTGSRDRRQIMAEWVGIRGRARIHEALRAVRSDLRHRKRDPASGTIGDLVHHPRNSRAMLTFRAGLLAMIASLNLGPALGQDNAQEEPGLPRPKVLRPTAASETVQAINEDYNRQLLTLERQRLERLAQLAARQAPADAAETYETLFRLAIANNLFAEAEPAAERALKSTTRPSPVIRFLAQTIDIIAAADRGAYDESLADLRKLIGDHPDRNRPADASATLDTASQLAICSAYHQRLIQGDQFDVARRAFQLIGDETSNPAIKEFCTSRLKRLNMVGKPAPPLKGADIDGKTVNLADYKGSTVLIVFWASWCPPSSAEIAWLDQAYDAYRNRGLRVLGINVDTLPGGETKIDTVMPNIKRFLLDHNVRWPNLVNGQGAHDYAGAYGITDIPANVLIGPDGNVSHLDLSRKNLNRVIAAAVSRR